MSDENTLDAFITTNTGQEPQKQTEEKKEVRLEDEFAKLLNDFIQHDQEQEKKLQATLVAEPTPTPQKQNKAEAEGLENFLQNMNLNENSTTSANQPQAQTPATQSAVSAVTANQTVDNDGLKAEEHELARAVSNFQDGIYALADKKNLKMPTTDYNPKMLSPNYKPSVGKKIAQYMLECWDLINHYDPESLKKLPKDAGDEEYLTFAESLNDTDLQLAIISYIEILINMEICEVSYAQKKEIAQKNRIKRELYEEYMELQQRKTLFIQKLKEKKFPIDVDKLIGNYFRVAAKDAEGSFNALTKNPAMFSPIEFDKIRPKFFGLIKVTPEDGIKANQRIGNFIKKLKV